MNILNWITENQNLIIVALVCLTYVMHLYIGHKAKQSPDSAWAEWLPASERVNAMVWQGAEWWGGYKKKNGDEKLSEYLSQLKAFETNYKQDKAEAVQKLLAWYLSQKQKAIAVNPITADSVAKK